MAVTLSALHVSRALPPEKIIFLLLVLICVRSLVNPRAKMRLEGLDEVKNVNNLIGTQAHL
jgi:hypothetical protein